MRELIHIDERKWPDLRHWQMRGERLGEDAYGVWLLVPEGASVKKGDEPAIRLEHGLVMLVPANDPWLAEFYADHPTLVLYLNIGTRPVWDGDRVSQIDLDLDVVRNRDGSVHALDEDEFLDNQVRLRYPPDVVAQARAATGRAMDRLATGAEPYAIAYQYWMGEAGLDGG